MAMEIYGFLQQFGKFKESFYRISIKIAFRESILPVIGDPGLRDGEDIILRTE